MKHDLELTVKLTAFMVLAAILLPGSRIRDHQPIFQNTVQAASGPRCALDVSNPAITHTPIPIHGGSFQGVTQYNSPSEWPFISHQIHWAPSNDMAFDDTAGPGEAFNIGPRTVNYGTGEADIAARIMNPATGHVHLEWCMPYLGEISGPITVPFQILLFHFAGRVYMDPPANMTTSVVYDDGPSWPAQITFIQGDPHGIVKKTGHFTWDPRRGNTRIANMHGPAANGWTNFGGRVSVQTSRGDTTAVNATDPIWTVLDPHAPLVPDFVPLSNTGTGVTSRTDLPQAWGSQVIEIGRSPLPLLAPFSTVWPITSLRGYSYGGREKFADNSTGFLFMLRDPDVHNGILGVPLFSFHQGPDGNFGFLDPATITSGVHKVAFIWQMPSGPNGVPGIAAPNETLSALTVFTVEVGN